MHHTFRPCLLLALVLTTLSTVNAEPQPKKQVKKTSPVTARLIVKQKEYLLPAERHGEKFRQQILTETDGEKLPAAPKVKLILELKNVSQEDVMIWPRGSITRPNLTVKGKGIVEPDNLRTVTRTIEGTSVQPVIAPGKTHRIKINSLNPEGGSPQYFWSEPGEYFIQASYVVHTGLPPFPFPDPNVPVANTLAKKAVRYEVLTPEVKVQVVLEKLKN